MVGSRSAKCQLTVSSWSANGQLNINSWSSHDQLNISSWSSHGQLKFRTYILCLYLNETVYTTVEDPPQSAQVIYHIPQKYSTQKKFDYTHTFTD